MNTGQSGAYNRLLLTINILESNMGFIDAWTVNVASPAIKDNLRAGLATAAILMLSFFLTRVFGYRLRPGAVTPETTKALDSYLTTLPSLSDQFRPSKLGTPDAELAVQGMR